MSFSVNVDALKEGVLGVKKGAELSAFGLGDAVLQISA